MSFISSSAISSFLFTSVIEGGMGEGVLSRVGGNFNGGGEAIVEPVEKYSVRLTGLTSVKRVHLAQQSMIVAPTPVLIRNLLTSSSTYLQAGQTYTKSPGPMKALEELIIAVEVVRIRMQKDFAR